MRDQRFQLVHYFLLFQIQIYVSQQICGALAEEGKSLEEIHQVASNAAKDMGRSNALHCLQNEVHVYVC